MKLSTLSNILFLGSLLLLSPMIQTPVEVILVQQTPTSKAVEIHQPEIRIRSSVDGIVSLHIKFIDTLNDETINITDSVVTLTPSNSSVTFDVTDEGSGFYVFDFISTSIGTVEIEGQGIYLSSIFIILLFVIIRVAIWAKERFL